MLKEGVVRVREDAGGLSVGRVIWGAMVGRASSGMGLTLHNPSLAAPPPSSAHKTQNDAFSPLESENVCCRAPSSAGEGDGEITVVIRQNKQATQTLD